MKLFLCFLVFSEVGFAAVKNWYGVAYDKSEKKVLYHEIHELTLDDQGLNKKVVTRYLNPDLKEFARIQSDFKENLFVPDSVQTDSRTERRETLVLKDNEAQIQIFEKEKMKSEKTLKVKSNFVAGQGFNNYIIKNFDELAGGQSKEIAFVVIPLLDYFRFEAKRVGKATNDETKIDFKIQIASLLLKAFADPILVQYDKKSRDLLEFRGLSNLNDEKGEKPYVVIKFSDKAPTP